MEKKDVDSLKGMVKDKYTYYGTRDGERFLARAEEFKVEKKKNSKIFTFSNREFFKILFPVTFFIFFSQLYMSNSSPNPWSDQYFSDHRFRSLILVP